MKEGGVVEEMVHHDDIIDIEKIEIIIILRIEAIHFLNYILCVYSVLTVINQECA